MTIAISSLILFVVVIALGAILKKNTGIIGLLAASVFGYFVVGMKAKEIYVSGWPTYVFFIILAATLLFGIANVNGTTKTLTHNIMCLCKGRVKALPFVFGALGGILSACGGSCLIITIIMPIALSIAVECGLNIIMTALVVMCLIMAGSLSPLAINGIVAKALAAEQGAVNYAPMWEAYAVSMIIFAVLIWLVFRGWKIDESKNQGFNAEYIKFTKMQLITLAVIPIVCIVVIAFGIDIGLACISFAAILLMIGACDQKQAMLAIPWNTLFLICGMGVLINVVVQAGGFDLLTTAMSDILTPNNSQPIMIVLSGLMGAVSSSTGVVMPTLFPLAGELAAANSSLSIYVMAVGIVVGTHGVVISPLSSIGAICMGCTPEGSVDANKMFISLLLAAIIFTILAAAVSFIGLYGIFY
jgi:di/tricarboxylate transporter